MINLTGGKVNKKHLTIIAASFFTGVIAVGTVWQFSKTTTTSTSRGGADDAFLAMIKNDQASFENWVQNGGDLSALLPTIDGKNLTVAEGLAHFERTNFIKYLQANKVKFMKQNKDGKDDIMSLAVAKNNAELFSLLMKENPDLTAVYGEKGHSLMHLVSANCASKLTSLLKTDKLSWNTKAKDGSTPLTLAASSDCLAVLSYWKDQKADFNQKDGRGTSAMSVMRGKKDAAMLAFLQSFETRRDRVPASAFVEPEINFYKKRVVPKDQKIDYSALIEPEDRPLDATETAEHSEFAD
jgi:ankyrin repeat protein